VQVAFGENHWAVVSAGVSLFTAGDNSWGQLGRWIHDGKSILQLENVFWHRVSSVASGQQHTLIVYTSLTMGGQQVWGCGRNLDHQLSVESWQYKSEFFQINISKMTCAAGCDVPESAGTACQPGSILRITACSEFSVVYVNDVVGIIGNGYPRLPDWPPCHRFVEFCIPAESAAALPWHCSRFGISNFGIPFEIWSLMSAGIVCRYCSNKNTCPPLPHPCSLVRDGQTS
jgi:hypothetical protein